MRSCGRVVALISVGLLNGCLRLMAPSSAGAEDKRTNGQTCGDATQCASGQCVDGVCCVSACNQGCHTCALPGAEGRCLVAEDDTDPRASCGACHACFAGTCRPALPATDPKRECGETGTCNGDGACALGAGAACNPDTAGVCAQGACVESSCVQVEEQVVEAAYRDANTEFPHRVLSSARGISMLTAAVVTDPNAFDEFGCPMPAYPFQALHFQLMQPGGVRQHVFGGAVMYDPADMVETSGGFRVFYQGNRGGLSTDVLESDERGLSPRVVIHTFLRLAWLRAAVSDAGRVVVAGGPSGSSDGLVYAVRAPGGDWVESPPVDDLTGVNGARPSMVFVGELAVMVVPGPIEGTVRAVVLDGENRYVAQASVPACVGDVVTSDVAVQGTRVTAVLVCDQSAVSVHSAVVMELDVGTPSAPTFGPASELVFDPPLAVVPEHIMPVARSTGVQLVLHDGATLFMAWPTGAPGAYRRQPISVAGEAEQDVGTLCLAAGAGTLTVAWSAGHWVPVVGQVPDGCQAVDSPTFYSRLILTQVKFEN